MGEENLPVKSHGVLDEDKGIENQRENRSRRLSTVGPELAAPAAAHLRTIANLYPPEKYAVCRITGHRQQRRTETRRTKINSRWSTSIASPSAFMFHKTRNLKDSRRSTASDRFTSRTTFRTGFEKCCHSPSGFCEPDGFVEYALEYFEIGCAVVEMVERDIKRIAVIPTPS